MDQYRIYIDKDIRGPFGIEELLALPGFSEKSLICEVGDDAWQPAKQIPAIRFQLAPKLMNISETPPPTFTPPTPIPYQPPNVTRVSYSGDFVSPDFQLGPSSDPGPRLRMRRPVPQMRPVKSISLPVGSSSPRHSGFFRLAAIASLISITIGLWAYGIRPSIPAPVAQWWRSNIAPLSQATPPPNTWRPAVRHSKPPQAMPAPVHPKIDPRSHRSYGKRHPAAHASHPKFKHTSRKPWFDLRDKPIHRRNIPKPMNAQTERN